MWVLFAKKDRLFCIVWGNHQVILGRQIRQPDLWQITWIAFWNGFEGDTTGEMETFQRLRQSGFGQEK